MKPKDRRATGQGPKKDKRGWKAEAIAVEGSRKEAAELASNAEAFKNAPYLHSSGICLYINEQGALLGGSQDIHPPPPHCSSLSAKGFLYQDGNHNGTVMDASILGR